MKNILHTLIILVLSTACIQSAFATGEPATKFNIFIPPNNDSNHRDVCLIVTAIYDSTIFQIIDDGMDGDTDDSKAGMLMAGQSYILYIRDNGINDDNPSASNGIKKQDGDYFIITANNLILASQSTDSDWQHDWVPSISGTGLGTKFIIYAPKISSSQRDVNVMAYEDSTMITIRRISNTPTTTSGTTNVDMFTSTVVAQRLINKGQDIIYYSKEGRDLLVSGHTYVIESNKPVTTQYGALFGNERDGGGYVPSSNGSCSGDLFYFTVPYQVTTEQEIRIVSWSDNNAVILERYVNGTWINVKNFNPLNYMKSGEWIGKTNGQTYATVFRVSCSPGKKVSVFEANWMETGSVGTSDIATMASAENGKASGKKFLVYMAPPGYEQNVLDPFTNKKLTQNTHAYLFANSNEATVVTVKDAYTNGTHFSKTFTIAAGRYADCSLTLTEWKNIYNGTGTTAAGAERPYLIIESTEEVAVMVTNFNDNWMMYFGSSQVKGFSQTGSTSTPKTIPGNEVQITNNLIIESNTTNASVEIVVGSGLIPVSSQLINTTTSSSITGTITTTNDNSSITFATIPVMNTTDTYVIHTTVIPALVYNDGNSIPDMTVLSVETVLTGTVNGETQQSISSTGITDNSANTSNFIFSKMTTGILSTDKTTSWTSNWVDADGDGDDDLFVTENTKAIQNILYINNGNRTFTKRNSGIFTSSSDRAASISSSWADTDNDGDIDFVVANNGNPTNFLYTNNGNGSFSRINNSAINSTVGYYHGVSFADYDNDGFVDLFMTDYMPTRFNRLFHNNGDGTFTEILNSPIVAEASYSITGSWADYDKDGDQDLFVVNDKGFSNTLYQNKGNGIFEKVNSIVSSDNGFSVSACWGDYDNDNDLDLYVTNSNSDAFLYNNAGDGTFTKITNSIITKTGNGATHGTNWVDIDKDGDLDLYFVANNKTKALYINNGNGVFTKKITELLNSSKGSCYGHTWSDFDKDGDMDVFVTTLNNETNTLYTNNGNSNKWIEAKLTGTASNKSAIGGRIEVFARIHGTPIWQMREINAQSGLGGQNSLTQHFGLADAGIIDSMIIYWPSGFIQRLSDIPSNQILSITEPNSSILKGIVFNDLNHNCIYDSGEEIVSGKKVLIQPGNIYCATNNSGIYEVHVPTGTYTVSLVADTYWRSTCSTSTTTITQIGQIITAGPIAARSNGNQRQDMGITISPTSLRRGFKNQLKIQYSNSGNLTSVKDTIRMIVPNDIFILQSSIPWNNISNGNEYQWYIDPMEAGDTQAIFLIDSVSVYAPLDAFRTFDVSISNYSQEENLLNNSQLSSMKIIGSFDPNDMTVYPMGEGTQGYVSKGTTLNYTIHFENTGNYPADKVIITCILSEHLDKSALSIESSSHSMSYEIQNNILTCTFNQINLVGNKQDSLLAQGFVRFSIPIKNTSAAGSSITNQAYIIFDFNQPVATNIVRNTIKLNLPNDAVSLYPNPATTHVVAALISAKAQYESICYITSYTIENMDGKTIRSMVDIEQNVLDIDLTAIKNGIYLIKFYDSTGQSYINRLIVQ
ncbi:FG-GAP-like repeat-containing protein [Cytophaga hutchinsonii]|nr:FG-GAP-like repeat-containing protein [Cytophaga hutchinsonii]